MKTTGDELLDRMAVFLVRLYASRSCFISEADWQKVFADYDARAEVTHSTASPTRSDTRSQAVEK